MIVCMTKEIPGGIVDVILVNIYDFDFDYDFG
jgi:hypothetical protein